MAIKTVDIADAGVVESIRSKMAVVTETANGLMESSFKKTGPKGFAFSSNNLYCIGDVTKAWDQNATFLWLSNHSNSSTIYLMFTRGETTININCYFRKHFGSITPFKIYKKGNEFYIWNSSKSDSYSGFVYAVKGFTYMGKYETLDSTYEEMPMTEIQ